MFWVKLNNEFNGYSKIWKEDFVTYCIPKDGDKTSLALK